MRSKWSSDETVLVDCDAVFKLRLMNLTPLSRSSTPYLNNLHIQYVPGRLQAAPVINIKCRRFHPQDKNSWRRKINTEIADTTLSTWKQGKADFHCCSRVKNEWNYTSRRYTSSWQCTWLRTGINVISKTRIFIGDFISNTSWHHMSILNYLLSC